MYAIGRPFRAEPRGQARPPHARAVVAVADSAAGYAASSLMPADAAVLTVELKVSLLAPASGERCTAVGSVRRAGRTLTVTETEVTAWRGGAPTPVQLLLGTMMTARGRAIRG